MKSSRGAWLAPWLLVAAWLPGVAAAWWNDDWAFRKEITFDLGATGANLGATPVDVPVLIRLSLANFEFFADTKPDGSDFRFIGSDDKTPLKFHIERYDAQSQMAFIWVRMPALTAGANTQKIYLYYGNPEAPTAADAAGTYDARQALVYHFPGDAAAARDSTGYESEPAASTAEINPASLIGAGLRFSGATSVTIPVNAALRFVPSQGYTVSAWVRIENPQSRAYVFALQDDAGSLGLGIDGVKLFASSGPAAAPTVIEQTGDGLATSTWHHVALRIADGRTTLFLDGVEVGSGAGPATEIGGQVVLGASAANANYLTGELDEVQVSSTGRATEWLQAAARSQGMVAPLVVYGGDTQQEGGGENYFASTLRNVTIDGWVVIAVLVVMLFWSIGIMISKSLFLGRVSKGNAAFLAQFRKMRDDPAAVERLVGNRTTEEEESAFEEGSESQLVAAFTADKGAFGVSTLYRLYHHGIREVMTRLEGRAAGADRAKTLSPAAIESIRATMDASLTRMTQRLNSQMVLLTISIAGGPFLGLLGTVVGVMITFAAIAASGDVNINAIAPGVAAALVATVAGLAVAIPCLFGYNWLNTRIREIVADMRVFVDEFVTRIAETYT